MADRKHQKIAVQDKFADELGVLVSFLDPHLKTRSEAKPLDAQTLWPWRKTIGFILVMGLVGWGAILGLFYVVSKVWG